MSGIWKKQFRVWPASLFGLTILAAYPAMGQNTPQPTGQFKNFSEFNKGSGFGNIPSFDSTVLPPQPPSYFYNPDALQGQGDALFDSLNQGPKKGPTTNSSVVYDFYEHSRIYTNDLYQPYIVQGMNGAAAPMEFDIDRLSPYEQQEFNDLLNRRDFLSPEEERRLEELEQKGYGVTVPINPPPSQVPGYGSTTPVIVFPTDNKICDDGRIIPSWCRHISDPQFFASTCKCNEKERDSENED